VQETLLAALESAHRFSGRSEIRTWLVGILRFKIIDALRARLRDPVPASQLEAELRTEDLEALFDGEGLWGRAPSVWHDPLSAAEQEAFLRVLQACVEKLAPNAARVFVLRELFGLESAEVCELLRLSRSNLGVLLYRARMSLRRCVELNWVKGGERRC